MDGRPSKAIAVVAVGREILTGRTLDTNSHWIARKIYSMGGLARRMAAVDDDLEEIQRAIHWSLEGGTALVITTGGLGPTSDDLTLEGVARALDLSLVEHPEALKMVEERYRELFMEGAVDSADLTDQRRKMARLPVGATPLHNAVGVAPGIWLETPRGVISSIPGVPAEMQHIFERHLEERIRALLGARHSMERLVETPLGDESVLGTLVGRASKRVPDVYMKTLPTTFGPEVRLSVRLEASGEDPQELKERIERAHQALMEEVEGWLRGGR
jgi:molybdenum cofactor synthesis domain-containing protein